MGMAPFILVTEMAILVLVTVIRLLQIAMAIMMDILIIQILQHDKSICG